MKTTQFKKSFFTGAVGFLLVIPVHAGTPLWTFSAPNPASVLVSEGGVASVQYTVTNQSRKSKRLILKPVSGLSASPCVLATRGSTCTLTLTVNGSGIPAEGIHGGPVLCEQSNPNQCYQPSANNVLNIRKNNSSATSLQTSVSNLALSVTGLTEYGVSGTPSSGLARVITITNTGSNPAVNLSVTTPKWPAGTTDSTTCGSTLAASSSCTITVTPGATATSDGTNPCSSGTAPAPGTIQVSADNAATVSSNVVVLGYGCIYQGGYVYAFDDSTPSTHSVGGKVVTTSDQAAASPNGIIWSSNGSGGTAFDIIYGISELSTTSAADPNSNQVTGQTACNGATDGSCNTNNIYVYYKNNATNAPINLSDYAVGLCKQTISSYSDWYLPAICEMGYTVIGDEGAPCGTSSVPTLQNMRSSLINISGINIEGEYWSSTGSSGGSYTYEDYAWEQLFAPVGDPSGQFNAEKLNTNGVRCSRALTP